MELSEIKAWIERRLKEKELSPHKASKLAGHPDSIRNILREKAYPKITTLRAIADVLGEPPPGLLNGTAKEEQLPPDKPFTLDELRASLAKAKEEVEARKKEVESLESAIATLEAWQQKKLG